MVVVMVVVRLLRAYPVESECVNDGMAPLHLNKLSENEIEIRKMRKNEKQKNEENRKERGREKMQVENKSGG